MLRSVYFSVCDKVARKSAVRMTCEIVFLHPQSFFELGVSELGSCVPSGSYVLIYHIFKCSKSIHYIRLTPFKLRNEKLIENDVITIE